MSVSKMVFHSTVVGLCLVCLASLSRGELPDFDDAFLMFLVFSSPYLSFCIIKSYIWPLTKSLVTNQMTFRKLKQLKELKDMGVISESEYDQKILTLKQKI